MLFRSSSLFPLTFASYKMRKYTMLRVCFLLLTSWWDPQYAPCYGCIFSYKTHQSKLWVPPTCKKERNMHPVMGVFSPTKLTNPNCVSHQFVRRRETCTLLWVYFLLHNSPIQTKSFLYLSTSMVVSVLHLLPSTINCTGWAPLPL